MSTIPDADGGAEETMDDVAAAMGFSAFGRQPHKKRKYNGQTDGTISVSQSQAVINPNSTSLPSGSNAILINPSRSLTGRMLLASNEVNPVDGVGLCDAGPQYVDDTPPDSPRPHESGEKEAISTSTVMVESRNRKEEGKPDVDVGLLVRGAVALPPKPPESFQQSPRPGRGGGIGRGGGGVGGTEGRRNELWYVDYWDPSFVENPWKELEGRMGLKDV
jgi:hypothetical protein